jgi:hypothetical protein
MDTQSGRLRSVCWSSGVQWRASLDSNIIAIVRILCTDPYVKDVRAFLGRRHPLLWSYAASTSAATGRCDAGASADGDYDCGQHVSHWSDDARINAVDSMTHGQHSLNYCRSRPRSVIRRTSSL